MGASRPHRPSCTLITKTRLRVALHPLPISDGAPGKRAEVLLDRQAALLRTTKSCARSPCRLASPSTPAPPGNYRVYAKSKLWSVPFREWLPWALPFVGGIALHELQD